MLFLFYHAFQLSGTVVAPTVTTTTTGGGGGIARRNYYRWAKSLEDAARSAHKKRKKQFADLDKTIEDAVAALRDDAPELVAEAKHVLNSIAELRDRIADMDPEAAANAVAVSVAKKRLSAFIQNLMATERSVAERKAWHDAFLKAREEDDLAVILLAS